MRYQAKVTSKGQITVPAEVREALGLAQGDMLAFELKAGYAELSRVGGIEEVVKRHWDLLTRPALFASDREAIAAYFDDLPPDDESPVPLIVRARHPRLRDAR